VYIVQELADLGELTPSLFKFSSNTTNVSIETTITQHLLDMTSAIAFLHSLNIVHRDIKPSNFLVFTTDDNMGRRRIKLTDFDTCYTLTGDIEHDRHELFSKLIGTPLFLAPELLNPSSSTTTTTNSTRTSSAAATTTTKQNFFTKTFKWKKGKTHSHPLASSSSLPPYIPFALDLWSLGVSLHYLLYGTYPFYADNEYSLLHQISTTQPTTPSPNELSFAIDTSHPIFSIINGLLIKHPHQRLTLKQLLAMLHMLPPPPPPLLPLSNNYGSNTNSSSSSNSSSTLPIVSEHTDMCISDLSTRKRPSNLDRTPISQSTSTHQFSFQLPIFMSPNITPTQTQSQSQLQLQSPPLSAPVPTHAVIQGSSTSLPTLKPTPTTTNITSTISPQHTTPPSHVSDYALIMNTIEQLDLRQPPSTFQALNTTGNRSSVHTIPTSLRSVSSTGSGSASLMKHSDVMNFKKFMKSQNQSTTPTTPVHPITMDDYLDKLS
jgi:serine/threonine protein kinase